MSSRITGVMKCVITRLSQARIKGTENLIINLDNNEQMKFRGSQSLYPF